MAKLPGIDYGGRPQSLGRMSPNLPVAAAKAQAAAAQAGVRSATRVAEAATGIGRIHNDMARQLDAFYAREDSRTKRFAGQIQTVMRGTFKLMEQTDNMQEARGRDEYKRLMMEKQTGLYENPTVEVPIDPNDESKGTRMQSRHITLVDDYEAIEAEVRDAVLDGVSMPGARQRLTSQMDASKAEGVMRATKVSMDWLKKNNLAEQSVSFNNALMEKNIFLATNLYEDAMGSGMLDPIKGNDWRLKLGSASDLIATDNLIGLAKTDRNRADLHVMLDDGKTFKNLTPTQLAAQHALLDEGAGESFAGKLQYITTDGMNLGKGDEFIRNTAKGNWKSQGFSDRKVRDQTVRAMKGHMANLRFEIADTTKSIDTKVAMDKMNRGEPYGPKMPHAQEASNQLMAEVDKITEERTGEKVEVLSPDWGKSRMALTDNNGWVSKQTQAEIESYLLSDNNPANVVKAVTWMNILKDVDRTAWSKMLTEKDRAFGETVNALAKGGIPEEKLIQDLKKNIYSGDISRDAWIESEFKTSYSSNENAQAALAKMIDGDPEADPMFSWAAQNDPYMAGKFNDYRQYNWKLVKGSSPEAMNNLSYAQFKKEFPLNVRSGQLGFADSISPEGEGPLGANGKPKFGLKWYAEETNEMLKPWGLGSDEVILKKYGRTPEGDSVWIGYTKDTYQPITKEKGQLFKMTFKYEDSKQFAREAKEKQQQEDDRESATERELMRETKYIEEPNPDNLTGEDYWKKMGAPEKTIQQKVVEKATEAKDYVSDSMTNVSDFYMQRGEFEGGKGNK